MLTWCTAHVCTFLLQVIECSNALVAKVDGQNRRSLDAIGAKCYFYYARAYELTDRLHEIRR